MFLHFVVGLALGFISVSSQAADKTLVTIFDQYFTAYSQDEVERAGLMRGKLDLIEVIYIPKNWDSAANANRDITRIVRIANDPTASRLTRKMAMEGALTRGRRLNENQGKEGEVSWDDIDPFLRADLSRTLIRLLEGSEQHIELACLVFLNEDILRAVVPYQTEAVFAGVEQRVLDAAIGIHSTNHVVLGRIDRMEDLRAAGRIHMMLDGGYAIRLNPSYAARPFSADVLRIVLKRVKAGTHTLSQLQLDALTEQTKQSFGRMDMAKRERLYLAHQLLIHSGDVRGFDGIEAFTESHFQNQEYHALLRMNPYHSSVRKAFRNLANGGTAPIPQRQNAKR